MKEGSRVPRPGKESRAVKAVGYRGWGKESRAVKADTDQQSNRIDGVAHQVHSAETRISLSFIIRGGARQEFTPAMTYTPPSAMSLARDMTHTYRGRP